jgi:hypothetical protein
MIAYYGTKRVEAEVREHPDEHGNPHQGYRVRYEDGHESWSPKAVFEAAYKPETCMGFEGALAALKAGRRVARAEWIEDAPTFGAKYLTKGKHFLLLHRDELVEEYYDSEDLLAEDWTVVEG